MELKMAQLYIKYPYDWSIRWQIVLFSSQELLSNTKVLTMLLSCSQERSYMPDRQVLEIVQDQIS